MTIEALERTKGILSTKLVEMRKRAGFRSREKFAEKAGIPFPTYRDIESGKSWPEHKNLTAIAKALGVDESELFAPESSLGEESADQRRLRLIETVFRLNDDIVKDLLLAIESRLKRP